jgi:fibronectin-binding autotransporter adhesin
VLGLDIAGARAAFDTVSGEIHASLRTTLFEDSRFPREAVLRRLEGAAGSGSGAWAEGFGSWGASNADGNAARLDRDSAGFVAGIDTALGENWRFGVAGGFSHHTLDLPARLSNSTVEQTHGLVYAGGEYGAVRISFGAGYSHLSARTDRSAVFTGFTDRLRANYGGSIVQAFGELGYRIGLSGRAIEPFARVAVVRVATDGFTESGGAAALRVDGASETRTTTTLGLHFATPVAGALSVDARIGWRHAFGAATPVSTLQFASGGSAFAVAGLPYSREAGVAEGGFTLQASRGLAFWTRYSGVIGDQGQDNSVKGGFSLTF